MTLLESCLKEIDRESIGTVKILECVPSQNFDWKPHSKSMTLKQLSSHIALIPSWVNKIVNNEFYDFGKNPLSIPEINNTSDIVSLYKRSTNEAILALQSINDDDLNANWKLLRNDIVRIDLPRYAAVRNLAMNHLYHHRGQLGVYLRLLDISIPGIYGQSADDKLKN